MTDIQQTPDGTATVTTKKRVRLPAPRKVLARTLQRLEKIVQSAENGTQELSQPRLIEILLTQARVAMALHREQVAAKSAALKAATKAQPDATASPEPEDEDVIRRLKQFRQSA